MYKCQVCKVPFEFYGMDYDGMYKILDAFDDIDECIGSAITYSDSSNDYYTEGYIKLEIEGDDENELWDYVYEAVHRTEWEYEWYNHLKLEYNKIDWND